MVRVALSLDGCRSKCVSRASIIPRTEMRQMDVAFSLDARRPKCVVITSRCTFLNFRKYVRGSLTLAVLQDPQSESNLPSGGQSWTPPGKFPGELR